ncbi:MAG: hypothetical protein DMF61_22080 [Blastocatellia bacterium AA13]|nr:MAG: hypothetical protein DMF61_22080 [Blastocatellia bacterium AA13]
MTFNGGTTMNKKFRLALALGVGMLVTAGISGPGTQAQDSDTGKKPAVTITDKDKGAVVDAEKTDEAQSSVKKIGAAAPQEKLEGAYTITSSIEVGAGAIVIEGNANKYRSDLNYTPGFRLFDQSLLIKSRENNGLLFDSFLMTSFGWGIGDRSGDPNRYLHVNTEKTGAYKFDATYRRFDFFNSLTNIALNQHNSNTEYRQGDFDLTILPQNDKLRFNLGYSVNKNSGPALTTYDYQRDEFPILSPSRWESNEYRIGVDAKLWVFNLSFLQGLRFFKDDTRYLVDGVNPGNNPTNTSVLNTFERDLPTRGTSPYTRMSVHTLLKKQLDFTARYIYTSSETKFNLRELATGKDASGNNIKSETGTAIGSAKRPNSIVDLGATWLINDRFRISDTFRVNNFRISGGEEVLDALLRSRTTAFGETPLPPVFTDSFSFRTTNYRRYQDTIEADYSFIPQFSAHFGYRYTNRHIELFSTDVASGAAPAPKLNLFNNSTHSVIFGFKAKPAKIWSLYFDLENGTSDNVFTRIASYDFTNVRVRSILRPTRTFSINASMVTKDNNNPSLSEDLRNFGADIKSRILSASADWTPNSKYSLSGGYTYSRVTSEAEIIFFLNNVKTLGESRYFLRDNFAFLSAYAELHPRLRVYAGYRIHHDGGQGDRVSTPTIFIGSYPLQFQSPEAKISVKLHERVDWIAGYQGFLFQETFPNLQRYRAHLPYTSLKIYFGRRSE